MKEEFESWMARDIDEEILFSRRFKPRKDPCSKYITTDDFEWMRASKNLARPLFADFLKIGDEPRRVKITIETID